MKKALYKPWIVLERYVPHVPENYIQACANTQKQILYAAERATECGLDAIQLLGGNGYVNEIPAGRLLRDAKLYEIGAGTSEIRRMVIGRAFNREYESY